MEGPGNSRRVVIPLCGEGGEEGVEVVGDMVVEEDLEVRHVGCAVLASDILDDALHGGEGVRSNRAAQVGNPERERLARGELGDVERGSNSLFDPVQGNARGCSLHRDARKARLHQIQPYCQIEQQEQLHMDHNKREK